MLGNQPGDALAKYASTLLKPNLFFIVILKQNSKSSPEIKLSNISRQTDYNNTPTHLQRPLFSLNIFSRCQLDLTRLPSPFIPSPHYTVTSLPPHPVPRSIYSSTRPRIVKEKRRHIDYIPLQQQKNLNFGLINLPALRTGLSATRPLGAAGNIQGAKSGNDYVGHRCNERHV